MKRFRWLVLTALLVTLFLPRHNFPAFAAPDSTEETAAGASGNLYAKNDALELYVDPENACAMTIRDIKTGILWRTTPEKYDSDDIAEGTIKNEMSSHLLVTFSDETNNVYTVNARVGSIKRETYKIRKFKDGTGIQIEYDFSRDSEQFIIPVKIQLVGNQMTAEILYDKINEYGDKKIIDITLFPYLMAGYRNEKGYLLISDGSGMLIDYKPTNKWAASYEEMIYGRDHAKTIIKKVSDSENILLPVFGCSLENSSVTAIITGGEYNACIGANPVGKYSNYANVYPKFLYRLTDTTVLSDKDWNARDVFMVRDQPAETNPKISYIFSTDDPSYNKMARLYRDYLIKEKGYQKLTVESGPALNLQFYGLTKKKESFLGFSVDKKIVATDFDDITAILKEIVKEDIKTNLLLYGFDNGGYQDQYDKKVSFDSAVGGGSGYKRLKKEAEKRNAALYAVYDPMVVYKTSLLMFRSKTAAKQLNRQIMWRNEYLLSTGERINRNYYIVVPELVLNNSKHLVDSAVKKGINIAFEAYGDTLYTDFNHKRFSGREETAGRIAAAADYALEKGLDAIVFGGNAYAAKGAVTEIPVASSGYDLESESIPFYQMVMHGLVTMSSAPLNQSQNEQEDFLRCLQTGTELKYSLNGKNNDKLRETALNFLYSGYYRDYDSIRERQKIFNQVHKGLQTVFIKSFERTGNITKTVYENGTVIFINFGETSETADGLTIPAKGFRLASE